MASSICEQRTQKQVKAPGLYESKGISHAYVIPLREVERGMGGILETWDLMPQGKLVAIINSHNARDRLIPWGKVFLVIVL